MSVTPVSDLITRVLALKKQIEIRKLFNSGTATQVKEQPRIIQKGTKEIEKLELPKESVVQRENVVVRSIQRPKETVRLINYGPPGAKGDPGTQGPKGDPGSIDNFIMDDLTAMFRSRLI